MTLQRIKITIVATMIVLLGNALCRAVTPAELELAIAIKEAELRLTPAPVVRPVVALPLPASPPILDATPRPTAPPALVPVRWPEYPSRSVSGRRWTYNGGQITAAHLANPGGHHAHEHFNRAWLNTQSNAQLTALGSDAHEGNVRERFVVRGGAAAPRATVRRQAAPTSSCPSGNCPNSNTMRRGLFGWRR